MWATLRHLLCATALLSGCAATAPSGSDIRAHLPDGRTIFFSCAGTGSPTVILDAGWGSDHSAWRPVMAGIAAKTRVCAYDRAGTGRSDPGPLPRDAKAIARDLDRALHAAGIAGPYVAVGHSIGALYVRAFANRRPGSVAGLVLVDGTVEYQQRRFEAAFGTGAGSVAPIIAGARKCLAAAEAPHGSPLTRDCALQPPAAARWRDRVSELETLFGATSREIADGPASYGDMPLITLTAANTYPGEAEQLWFALHQEVAQRSSRGQARWVADSGHHIAGQQPAAVVKAVNDVVDMARKP